MIFIWFEATSGLQINLAKTKVNEINRVDNWETVKGVLNCGIGHLPDTYLGLLLGRTFKQKVTWQDHLQNFKNNWHNRSINFLPRRDDLS